MMQWRGLARPRFFGLAVLLCGSASFGAVAVTAEESPNIVLVMMDNMGYGEPGVYGGGLLRGAPTPRIDGLADEGLRLLNFNVETQCTPTRAALIRNPYR